ncbi:MAG: LUD domain-containing protein [Desulfohalobiaceae bacterium]|nr:LUD domain-containing protein [Desulfohalobiaceae bacterium]
MQDARTLHEYRKELKTALKYDFQRKALENFTTAYRGSREKAFSDCDLDFVIEAIKEAKDNSLSRFEELYKQFKAKAEALGIKVHLAHSDREANEIISTIAAENDCQRVVKTKSMTAEEVKLSDFLQDKGLEITECDLGEWIIQLRREVPSHMVLPAIHVSKEQVSRLFSEVTGHEQTTDIQSLVKVARRELRQKFIEADMGISGANFVIAETGTLGMVTNEGNLRLATTLPRVHVALVGIDKLVPTLKEALPILKGLPRNATGQSISSYVTWITGANECRAAPEDRKIIHVVLIDNGRLALARDPVFSQALRCVRCGACANVCPVYRLVGGHAYGHVYIGPIGLILTYFFHGREKDRFLAQNCLNCQACKAVCVSGIDLPRLIKEVQAVIQSDDFRPALNIGLAHVLTRRRLFHSLLWSGKYLQKPVRGRSAYLRHLPRFLLGDQDFKALPALAAKPFRDSWPEVKPGVEAPQYRIALFSGCLQDFVYPEQLERFLELLQGRNIEVEFPKEQGCCGLPVLMVGEKEAALRIALHNLRAVDPSKYDAIVTLCASCGSHLKENYPYLAGNLPGIGVKVQQFADKIMDASSFLRNVARLEADRFSDSGPSTAYHAPCHLCRGLGVRSEPRELLTLAGYDYVRNDEEETCCGLGGTYSMKFPEVSATIVHNKLDRIQDLGVDCLVTDCPGCIMQLRGTAEKEKRKFKVLHMAEALWAQLSPSDGRKSGS